MKPIKQQRGLTRTFAAPMLIAALTLVGLIAALLGGGIYDIAAWITVGGPLIVATVLAWRRRR